MRSSSFRERRLWLLAGLLLLAIYATLYWARFATELLRQYNLLLPAIGILFGLGVVALVLVLSRRRPGRWEIAAAAVLAAVYALVLMSFGRPEEALHIFEYGLLGGLVYLALGERRRRLEATGRVGWEARFPALTAFLLTSAAGWGDEGIQHLLPNRYYDLRDVGFNAGAAALAIAAVAFLGWAREQDRRPREQLPAAPSQ